MFDKNYKNAMDDVTVDEQTRDKISDKIILKEELSDRKNPATVWRVAFACAACVAIILGVIFVPRDSFSLNAGEKSNASVGQTLKVTKSYDEIYRLIKPKKEFDILTGFGDDKDVMEEEIYYVTKESATDMADNQTTASAPSSTNGTQAKPGASDGENTKTDVSDDEEKDFSTTTEQVEGVVEADIVKTDGDYIYYILDNELSIYKADGQNSTLESKTTLQNDKQKNGVYGDMFLKDDRVIILNANNYYNDKSSVQLLIYDISDRKAPQKVAEVCQDGYYTTSRMVGDYVYLISDCNINVQKIDKDDPTTFVPTTETNGVCEPVPADSIYHYEQDEYNRQYTVIGAFDYKNGTLNDTASLLGGTDTVYCSQGNIILTNVSYTHREKDSGNDAVSQNYTTVSRLTIEKGTIEYKTSGEVDGLLENQFFIDEYNGYFRFVTTVTKSVEKRYKFDNTESEVISYSNETFAQLSVLDTQLKEVGKITDLAQGESVYSVRFMGDTAYFVTFRQTDPLFSADLSDPANPKILGELKIPGFSEYMYPYGEGLLLGFGMDADENTGRTSYLKLSMFNITDPANVTEQDKTVIDGYNYSTALDNHKSMLVHPDKNIIGFAAYDNRGGVRYMIYKHSENAFERVATLEVAYDTKQDVYKYYDAIRGLFINDNFYLVSEKGLQVFDMNTFLQISVIKN